MERMQHNGPGWFQAAPDGTVYQLWGPTETRDRWATAWRSTDGFGCGFKSSQTAFESLSIFPPAVKQQFLAAHDQEA